MRGEEATVRGEADAWTDAEEWQVLPDAFGLWGSGCVVQGPGFKVQSSGCRVQDAGVW